MRSLRLFRIPLFLVAAGYVFMVIGCLGGGGKLTTPPPFEEATRVVITPFVAGEKAGNLGKWVPITLATQFELALKETEWVYDQSETLNPVASKLKELGLTLPDIFEDPALAAKVGKALNADLILVGQLNDPNINRRDYNQPVTRQGRQVGISGSATYIRVRQSATMRAHVKVIDTTSGQPIYDNSIIDYIKYWFAFQTQQSGQIVFKSETEILADLGKHLPRRIAYELDPEGMPEVKEGEVLLRPDVELLGSGGPITFD